MKQKISFPLAVALIVVLSILVTVITWQYKPILKLSTSSSEETVEETIDWKTYTNKEYGFEIEYSTESWREVKEKLVKDLGEEIFIISFGCTWITIRKNPENLSVEKYYETLYENEIEEECRTAINFCSCFRYGKNLSKTNIAGQEAFRCEKVPGPLPSTFVLIATNDFIFHLGKEYTDYEPYVGTCKSLNTDKIFDQMLSTFKFIE